MSAEFDLAFLDEGFAPAAPAGRDAGVEDLTDGDYELAIRSAVLKSLKAKQMTILELGLEVLSPGKHQGAGIKYPVFLKDADSAARLGRDLMTLGFDCEDWTKANGRPFSQELGKAMLVLPGIVMVCHKKTNAKDGKTFHNLYINKRGAGDGKPQKFGPAELDAAVEANDSPF